MSDVLFFPPSGFFKKIQKTLSTSVIESRKNEAAIAKQPDYCTTDCYT